MYNPSPSQFQRSYPPHPNYGQPVYSTPPYTSQQSPMNYTQYPPHATPSPNTMEYSRSEPSPFLPSTDSQDFLNDNLLSSSYENLSETYSKSSKRHKINHDDDDIGHYSNISFKTEPSEDNVLAESDLLELELMIGSADNHEHDLAQKASMNNYQQLKATVTSKLKYLGEQQNTVNMQLEILRGSQRSMLVPIHETEYKDILNKQMEIRRATESFLSEIEELSKTVLLEPSEIHSSIQLERTFRIQLKQLELYEQELQYYVQGPTVSKCFGTLVIEEQPFPKSVKKETSVGGPITVRLLSGAKTDIWPASPVKAELIYEEFYQSKAVTPGPILSNDSQEMDQSGVAAFADLKFLQGTRQKVVRLQFNQEVQFIQIDGNIGRVSVVSDTSSPFIVLTNEKQWDVVEGTLLRRDAFEGQNEISWPLFANTLQEHYLRSTRQELSNAIRPLSREDLEYLHYAKFNSRPHITIRDFEKFWEYFGKILHQIRHQRHIGGLWMQGLIYGFMSKEDSVRLLSREEPGSFILRFSERRAGQFAVAFVKLNYDTGAREVMHYLIKPDDTSGLAKPLADFIRLKDNFKYLLQRHTEFSPTTGLIKARFEKNQILRDYYSSSNNFASVPGYVEDIE